MTSIKRVLVRGVVAHEPNVENETLVRFESWAFVICTSYHDDPFQHMEPIMVLELIHSLMC